MRRETAVIPTKTLTVRRKSDDVVCIINATDMDERLYERITPLPKKVC
jgi:hypothetical protein